MTEKQPFKAQIGGRNYTIVGHKDQDHLTAVVETANQQYNQLKSLTPELSREDRSMLMTINAISDQYDQEKKIVELEYEIEQLKQKLSKRHNPVGPNNNLK